MSEWSPESERPDDPEHPGAAEDADARVARVLTAHPVRLRLVAQDDDRAPAGSVVFRTLGVLEGAVPDGGVPDDAPVLAQGSLPTALFGALETANVFAHPVPILLAVQPDGDGIAGILYALVPQDALERLDRARRAADEPWLASVEETAVFSPAAEETATVPFALGAIVRFAEDRRHPESLADEAVDLLASLLVGRAMDADQKRIERLLKSL
ncbi:MAG: hypothetical protein ABI877_18600 [Gemmatimonadaceae bacterium]